MAQTYKDPVDYLNEIVTKRGKSGPDGVYLHNVTVVAEASSDYNYKVSYGSHVTPKNPPVEIPFEDWAVLLINLRSDSRSLSHEIFLENCILQILPEGNFLNFNVFLPSVEISTFPYLILYFQDIAKCLADFSTKISQAIRFNIGLACKSWLEMAEEGEVVETDLSY